MLDLAGHHIRVGAEVVIFRKAVVVLPRHVRHAGPEVRQAVVRQVVFTLVQIVHVRARLLANAERDRGCNAESANIGVAAFGDAAFLARYVDAERGIRHIGDGLVHVRGYAAHQVGAQL